MPPSTWVNQEPWLDSTTTPMHPCRPILRLRAIGEGVYPRSRAAFCTRSRTCLLAYPPFSTRDTVLNATFARAATCTMVALRFIVDGKTLREIDSSAAPF